jgi:hypothetical protein
MMRERDEKGRFLPAKGKGADGLGTPAGAPKRSAAARPKAAKGKAAKLKPWKKAKQEIFFRELATFCNVSSALRSAGLMSQSSTVYERRRTDPVFRSRWQKAIEQSYALLELEMLERGRFGDNRPEPQTEVEKRLRNVPTALGLQLLRLHQAAAKSRAAAAPAAAAVRRITRQRARALRSELERMLSELNRRMGGEG